MARTQSNVHHAPMQVAISWITGALATGALLALGCAPRQSRVEAVDAPPAPATRATDAPSTPAGWTVRADLAKVLPSSIRVLERVVVDPPLRAWMVEARPSADWRPEACQPERGLRTTSAQARTLGALVAVNAGFFAAAGSVSAVVDEGRLVAPGATEVRRGELLHPVARAAIGFDAGGRADCAWTWVRDGALVALDAPVPNQPGKPGPAPDAAQGRAWPAEELLGAGPMLVVGGSVRNTEAEECFQGVGRGARHPRTAAGWCKDGRLLLLVVDGRSAGSRGATLEEAAGLFVEFGAEEALNFDGGGSTTLWVGGEVVNAPSDKTGERPVASILALVPETPAKSVK
jgi:hypothetical protein